MVNRAGREALRGVAERVLDHIFEAFSSEQWANLLGVPLERAAGDGNGGLAQKLIKAGAEMGFALYAAIGSGHREVVNTLLENGAPVSDKDSQGFAPLHVAAQAGDAEMLRSLLCRGAEKDGLGPQGNTALHMAAQLGHLAATKALLAAGADEGVRWGAPGKVVVLHVAAEMGHVDVVRALLEHGADVEACDADGNTPLHLSSFHGRVRTIDVLVEAGANVYADNEFGHTPLHDAASQSRRGPCSRS